MRMTAKSDAMVFIQEHETFFGEVKLSLLYQGDELAHTLIDAEQFEATRAEARTQLLASAAIRAMKYILKNSNQRVPEVIHFKNRLTSIVDDSLVFSLFSKKDLERLKPCFPQAGPHHSGCLHALEKYERFINYYEKNIAGQH